MESQLIVPARAIGVSKRFDEVLAVDNVDLEVPQGIILGIIGPNGAGKTTLIRMMVGILTPTTGSCFLGETNSENLTPQERGRIGYMTQQKDIYPDLTARENLNFFAEAYGLKNPKKRKDAIIRVAKLSRILEYLDRPAEVLSGGTVQRLSLACTLAHEPEVLFLDEPIVGVSPDLRIEFWNHFQELVRSGRTIIMTTHYLTEASRCDIVVMMHQGRFISLGSPDEIMSSLPLKRTIICSVEPKDAPLLAKSLQGIADVEIVNNQFIITSEQDNLLEITSAISSSGAFVSDVVVKRPDLEDAFDYFVRRNNV